MYMALQVLTVMLAAVTMALRWLTPLSSPASCV
jgi:hypothetical protein